MRVGAAGPGLPWLRCRQVRVFGLPGARTATPTDKLLPLGRPGNRHAVCPRAEWRPGRLSTPCRYAPGVEGPMHHFHSLLHADLTANSLGQQGDPSTQCLPASPALA